MDFLILKLIIILISVFINVGNALKLKKDIVELEALAFSMNGGSYIYSPMINDFNKYSEKNNLNIKIHLNLFSELNSTALVKDYETMLDSLFSRKSEKYDLIFYDNIYSLRFGLHLIDLYEIMPQEHIDMYMEGIAKETCIYEDKLVGFPMTIDYTVLYYNNNFLEKYNIECCPKTWDELIKTGEYVLQEELKQNNKDFIVYNGLFTSK
ncbi:hypothetical protein PIROE2DRAFT_16247 [Piromyces sp. E2]|nr:hypothetical protein PIROE2DRAFT_16247 [Piromyces sp. E2]|eukprot:OUM58458.1 hypothetical protein PIROE2DRAFT_16247 [Piromyces sp. E2]